MRALFCLLFFILLLACESAPTRPLIKPQKRYEPKRQKFQAIDNHAQDSVDLAREKSDEIIFSPDNIPSEEFSPENFSSDDSQDLSVEEFSSEDFSSDDSQDLSSDKFQESAKEKEKINFSKLPLKLRIETSAKLVKAKSYEEAKKFLSGITLESGFDALSIYNKILFYSLDGQLKMHDHYDDNALISFNKALKIFNDNGEVSRQNVGLIRLVIYYRAKVHKKLSNYSESAQDLNAYIGISQQGGQEITSDDYKDLAVAYYLAEEFEECKAILEHVSDEDRKELAKTLNDELFYTNE